MLGLRARLVELNRAHPWVLLAGGFAVLFVLLLVVVSLPPSPTGALEASPFIIDEDGAPALIVSIGRDANVGDKDDGNSSSPSTGDTSESDADTSHQNQQDLGSEEKGGGSISDQSCAAGTRRHLHPGVGDSAPRVQFIHIPKAGGTSVQKALQSWCASTDKCSMMIFDGSSYLASSSRCPALVHVKTLLTGHRGFGYCREVSSNKKRGLLTFVVLREPVARVRSLFDYRLFKTGVLGKQTDDFSAAIVRFNSTPEMEKGEARLRALGMQQTRFLCGYHCMGPEAARMLKNMTIEKAERIIINRAKHNLVRIDAVGVLERFADLLPQLKYQFDFIPLGVHGWPRENAASPREKTKLSDKAVAILREWNRPDIELYAMADKIAKRKTIEALKCIKTLKLGR